MGKEAVFAIFFEGFQIPAEIDLLLENNSAVALEPQAVRVLRYLAANHGRVVSKIELLEQIWGTTNITPDVLKRTILLIRRALGDTPKEARFIKTFHCLGYQFIAPVEIKPAI